MCGILGIATRQPSLDPAQDERFLRAMQTLGHRGPDARGECRIGNVRLGHRRLSIIDLTPDGNQPMRSADGRFSIVYNAEVYNFRELAAAAGLQHLRSHSDTEVVLELFARHGVEALPSLNGMFAFAIHDAREERLWLVRDRLGIKPLYYSLRDGALAFASEIKGILALRGDTSTLDHAALSEWLYFGNALGGRTLYADIRQVLPGHYLELDLRTFQCTQKAYWTLEQQAMRAPNSGSDVVGETRGLLEQAVSRQLVADVPVSVFLSGGVDSSAITAFASRHYPGKLTTFAAGFDFAPGGSELPRARRVAERFGTEHHELQIAGEDIPALIEQLVSAHDAPFADAANIPLYLLAGKLGGRAKVVLQGDGGDELFGGYRRYATMTHRQALHALAVLARPLLNGIPGGATTARVKRYVNAFAASDIAGTMARLLTPEDPTAFPTAIFAPALRSAVDACDPFALHREVQRKFAALDIANQMSCVDLSITLPDLFFEKVDRATMAASVEVRVPFLDNDLLDFVMNLPGRTKTPRGRQKGLLKAALAGVVPDEVLQGAKHGLEVPVGSWLKGALKPFFFDQLATLERRHAELLDTAHVRRLFTQLEQGRSDLKFLLWKTLNIMVWANGSRAMA